MKEIDGEREKRRKIQDQAKRRRRRKEEKKEKSIKDSRERTVLRNSVSLSLYLSLPPRSLASLILPLSHPPLPPPLFRRERARE